VAGGHGPSALGFGWQPFGYSRGSAVYPVNVGYGLGDWGEEVTWRILPWWMRDEDGTGSTVEEPLRGFIDAIKPLLNELIKTWRSFPSLWDANTVPIEQLEALAYNVGITVDTTRNEQLQRSEVLNVAQLVVNKGTDQGYSILAAFEGLLVEITPLWAENKLPGATLQVDGPTQFVPHFDTVASDEVPLDTVYDDKYALWPKTLYIQELCRSYSLRLVFLPSDDPTQDFDPDVATRIAQRLLRYTPAHVVIDRIAFDGLRGASQVWSGSVSADAFGVGMWVGPVVAEQRASTQVWVDTVDADPVP
jgi:hypothetical protein